MKMLEKREFGLKKFYNGYAFALIWVSTQTKKALA